MERYASARDMFEGFRAAADEMRRYESAVRVMRAREGLHGQRLDACGHGSGPRDANAATDARMDYETSMRPAIDADRALVADARTVLHGVDGHGGISAICGPVAAMVLEMRYLGLLPWDAVGRAVCESPRTAQRRAAAALDAVDAYGVGRVVDGVGIACE